jgi:hypothetical protein
MFKLRSRSLVGSLAVVLLLAGCTPSTDEGSASSDDGSTSALAADAAKLLEEAGVVGDRNGEEALFKATITPAEGVSEAFVGNASAILREWYARSSLDPEVLNAPDLQTALDRVYTDFVLLPDFGTEMQESAPEPVQFVLSASYMGQTARLSPTIPTFAEFETYLSTDTTTGKSEQVMILRASSIYTTELPNDEAGLIVLERQFGIWSPEGVDDVKSNWSWRQGFRFFGVDQCALEKDLVLSPTADAGEQAAAAEAARSVVDGTAQTAAAWEGQGGTDITCEQ